MHPAAITSVFFYTSPYLCRKKALVNLSFQPRELDAAPATSPAFKTISKFLPRCHSPLWLALLAMLT